MKQKLTNKQVFQIRRAVQHDREVPPEIAVAIKLLCDDLIAERGKNGNKTE